VRQVSEPRDPVQIAHQILTFIEENGRASRWDLIKILGNTRQFGHWIDGFLLKDRFIAEESGSSTRFYSLTPNGELLLRLLKNGNVMRSITRLGGRRLRRSAL
jgi:predicted transcriptional regulator